MRRSLAVVLSALLLLGCEKELARITMRGEDGLTTSVNVQEGTKLSFWTSLDIELSGELVAHYDIEIYESGQLVGKTTCDPLDVSVKVGAKESTVGDKRSIAWLGKMRCELVAKSKGLAHVRVRLVFVKRPTTLSVRDMSLVIKR